MSAVCQNWLAGQIDGFLLDVYGVLYDSGTIETPIHGSIDAVRKLKEASVPVRLCSNTSTRTPASLAITLHEMGFDVSVDEIFTPAPAVCQYLRQHNLRPFIIVDPTLEKCFEEFDQTNCNCVVMGDAQKCFTYARLNTAFQLLINDKQTKLITMGNGKYYRETDGFKLDVGPFTKALEYACDIEAQVIGKPSKEFFTAALNSMNLQAENAVMIGDDIVSDVGGAQASGICAVQVRTGKYRQESDEPHLSIRPHGYVNNLLEAVDLYLKHRH